MTACDAMFMATSISGLSRTRATGSTCRFPHLPGCALHHPIDSPIPLASEMSMAAEPVRGTIPQGSPAA
jgi:hypothetical protein